MLQTPRPGPGATRWSGRRRAVAALLSGLLLGAVGGALPASAATDERGALAPRRLFDQSRPGVELITAQFTAEVTVPEPEISSADERELRARVVARVRRGEIPATEAAVGTAVFEEIARDPFRWYTKSGRLHHEDLKLSATGSGFSVGSDGYIVTNAHVAAPREEDLKATFLRDWLGGEIDGSIRDLAQDGLPQSVAAKYMSALVRWMTKMSRLSHLKRRLEAVTSSGTGGHVTSGRRAARLVTAGTQLPGKDVAILKVDARNMATVPLGDDAALSTGDRLLVLGFPAPATFNPVLSKESEKEPTLTQGVLSAKKKANGGFTVLQTDAAMTHGNSGGPVFDEQGRVIGVATFGSVDPRTGREVAGLNFAVPVSVVSELLSRIHVKPVEGTATLTYRLALDAFDKSWYKRALPLFRNVKALDPSHPLVEKFIKDSETAIAQGRDRTPREVLGLPLPFFAALLAVIGLLAIGVAVALARRGARHLRSSQPSTPPAQLWWAPPADRTVELPARVNGERLTAHPSVEEAPLQRDLWQGEWATHPAHPAHPARGHLPQHPAHPALPGPEPLSCWSCGHPNPPTNRFCEQCWSVLGS